MLYNGIEWPNKLLHLSWYLYSIKCFDISINVLTRPHTLNSIVSITTTLLPEQCNNVNDWMKACGHVETCTNVHKSWKNSLNNMVMQRTEWNHMVMMKHISMNKNLDKLVINYFEMPHYFFVVTFILHMFTTKMMKTEAEITLESVWDGIKYC